MQCRLLRGSINSMTLTLAQQRLWTFQRLDPGSDARLHAAFEFIGKVDAGRLEAALQRTMARHEALRRVVTTRAGAPAFEQVAPAAFRLDMRDTPAGVIAQIVCEETARPLPTEELPLRAVLVRLGADHALLVVTVNAIAADRTFFQAILVEVTALYARLDGSLPAAQPASAPQSNPGDIEWWRSMLDVQPVPLALPADNARLPIAPVVSQSEEVLLAPAAAAKLRTLATHAETTPGVVLLAAVGAVLERITRSRDLIVAWPTQGVAGPEGLSDSLLPVRLRGPWEGSFREHLLATRDAVRATSAHAGIPFDQLVDVLGLHRDSSYAPLCQVQVVESDPLAFPLAGIEVRCVYDSTFPTRCDLAFQLTADRVVLWYSPLFERATATRILGWLTTLLDAAMEAPGQPLQDLPLLPADEATRSRRDVECHPHRLPARRERASAVHAAGGGDSRACRTGTRLDAAHLRAA